MVECRFDQAMVSLFWTAAGMGLPDSVEYKYPNGSINFFVVFFFASFILILNWTLLQVPFIIVLTGNLILTVLLFDV